MHVSIIRIINNRLITKINFVLLWNVYLLSKWNSSKDAFNNFDTDVFYCKGALNLRCSFNNVFISLH